MVKKKVYLDPSFFLPILPESIDRCIGEKRKRNTGADEKDIAPLYIVIVV